MKTLSLIIAFAGLQLAAISQTVRVTNIIGRARVVGDVSPTQARAEALNDAKLNALRAAGIEEKISCYQSQTTDQQDDDNKQNFQSHIQSDILGAVKFDTVIAEGMVTDSLSNVYYQVKIDAEVDPYTPAAETTVEPEHDHEKINPKVENQPQQPSTTDYNYGNGDSYSGQFVNGKRDGYGTYRWANGAQYTGYYTNGLRNGPGVYYGAHGKVMSGVWANGVFTQYQNFTYCYKTRGNKTSGSGTYTQIANNTETVTPPTPQEKLDNDQHNFAQDVDAQQQKMQ